MDDLLSRTEALEEKYEQFIKCCDEVEAQGKWDVDELGEMEVWFANDFLIVILKLIASDGELDGEEVDFINEVFGNETLGFDYTQGELREFYENSYDRIDSFLEEDFPESIEMLEEIDGELADFYRGMISEICRVLIECDHFVSEREAIAAQQIIDIAENS